MEQKTYDELLVKIKEVAKAKVEEIGDGYCCQGYNDVGYFAQEGDSMCENYDSANEPFFGKVNMVDRTGGMDRGSDWSRIYYFEAHDVYIRAEGSYYSHDGCYFSDWDESVTEVVSEEKTITVYKRKQ